MEAIQANLTTAVEHNSSAATADLNEETVQDQALINPEIQQATTDVDDLTIDTFYELINQTYEDMEQKDAHATTKTVDKKGNAVRIENDVQNSLLTNNAQHRQEDNLYGLDEYGNEVRLGSCYSENGQIKHFSTFKYDENKNLDEMVETQVDSEGNTKSETKTIYERDEQGNIIGQLIDEGNDGTLDSHVVTIVDENGKEKQVEYKYITHNESPDLAHVKEISAKGKGREYNLTSNNLIGNIFKSVISKLSPDAFADGPNGDNGYNYNPEHENLDNFFGFKSKIK